MAALTRKELKSGDSVALIITCVDETGAAIDIDGDGLNIEWRAVHKKTAETVIAPAGWLSNASEVVTVALPKAELITVGNWTQELKLSNSANEFSWCGIIRVTSTPS